MWGMTAGDTQRHKMQALLFRIDSLLRRHKIEKTEEKKKKEEAQLNRKRSTDNLGYRKSNASIEPMRFRADGGLRILMKRRSKDLG